jgi:hypothetical protein
VLLNGDPLGCSRARSHYGRAYLVLQNIEDRVTYCYGDSGGLACSSTSHLSVGYGCWMARVLNRMQPGELALVAQCAGLPFASDPSSASHQPVTNLTQYLEIQVHGPIRFNTDVCMMCLPEELLQSTPAIAALAEQFCSENKVFLNLI